VTVERLGQSRTFNKENDMSKDDEDNHADQCNPNNDAYWESRGYDERPDDWEERSGGSGQDDD